MELLVRPSEKSLKCKGSNWPAEIYDETSNAGDARSEEEITFSRPWLDIVYLCFFSFLLFFLSRRRKSSFEFD